MYVLPPYRGKGYGRALLNQLLRKAKEFEYHSVYLDSGPFMTAAHHLYHSVRFVDREEYPKTEVPTAAEVAMAFHGKNPPKRNQMNLFESVRPVVYRRKLEVRLRVSAVEGCR